METFIWAPDKGATRAMEPRVLSTGFGDGYSQDSPDGLNHKLEKRSLSFSGRSVAEMTAIEAFLEARGAVETFYYTHPGKTQKKYKCRSWSAQDNDYLVLAISAEFTEVPL